MKQMNQNKEYHLLPVKLTPSSNVTRQLLVKSYESETCPLGKSLLILNVPPLVTAEALKLTFTKTFGKVTNSEFTQQSRKSIIDRKVNVEYNTAAIVFKDASSLEKVFQVKSTDSPVMSLTNAEEPGKLNNFLEIYKSNYNSSIISLDSNYLEKVDKLVSLYENHLAKREKAMKETPKNEVDEEGWITVKHKGKHSLNKDKAIKQRDKMKQIKKKRIESNVSAAYQYRMRSKEEKFARLRELRAKFEEDKLKLAQLKAGRKFKPV